MRYAGREVLEAKAVTNLAPADMLISRNEGGPGYGDPLRRDPERVAVDVRAGLCSAEDAFVVYGVVLDEDRLDAEATAARRGELRAARLAAATPVADAIERHGAEGALAGAGR